MARTTESLPLRIRVLALLTLYPSTGLHGYAIAKELGVSSGSLYPALARLLGASQLETRESTGTRNDENESRKRYVITEKGLEELRSIRAQLAPVPTTAARAPRRLRVAPAGGPTDSRKGRRED